MQCYFSLLFALLFLPSVALRLFYFPPLSRYACFISPPLSHYAWLISPPLSHYAAYGGYATSPPNRSLRSLGATPDGFRKSVIA
jgi:hypothetical protein